jgi:hypothetical protein
VDISENNPPSNTLGPGLADAAIIEAIKTSGYPLQLDVATLLSPTFSLQEEWSYHDPDTQTVRTIDIVATRYFKGPQPHPRARPAISFVIECKQSDLPYVFFLSETEQYLADFPIVGGLKRFHGATTTSSGWVRCSRRQWHRQEATDAPHQPDHYPEAVSLSTG